MAMTQINSNWHNLNTVKKGDIGEQLVLDYLVGLKRNFVCYRPFSDNSHLIGFYVHIGKSTKPYFAAEVKTKPKMNYYDETGFNNQHFIEYQKLQQEEGIKVFVFFVDENEAKIYGNWLDELNKECYWKGEHYPKVMHQTSNRGVKGRCVYIRYFPMCHMKQLCNLTDEEVAKLKSYRSSIYDD